MAPFFQWEGFETVDEISRSTAGVLISTLFAIPFVIINGYILMREVRNIRDCKDKFNSVAMKVICLLTLIFGFLQSLSALFTYINGFCSLRNTLLTLYLFPMNFMAIYQLHRLSYVLPPSGEYKRYPLPFLVFIGAFGVVLSIIDSVAMNSEALHCGLDANLQYHAIYKRTYSDGAMFALLMFFILNPFWELLTLYLFVRKLKRILTDIRVSNTELREDIRRNMERIIVLTLFYLMIYFMFWIAALVFIDILEWYDTEMLLLALLVTGYSVAMWLMQLHNTKEYAVFLQMLGRFFGFSVFRRYGNDEECTFRCFGANIIFHQHVRAYNDFSSDQGKKRVYKQDTARTAFNEFDFDVLPVSHRNGDFKDLNEVSIRTFLFMTSKSHTTSMSNMSSANTTLRHTLRHDFLFEHSPHFGPFTSDFGFGVYLEYWRRNHSNFVKPRHRNLRTELTMNAFYKIPGEIYSDLERKCKVILERNNFTAKNIGTTNKMCRIESGTPMTLEHAIAIKAYTDCDHLQREFKRHCRRLKEGESIESVMHRNKEIAHWCRLLKEGIMFYGETMSDSEVVYSGMNARLLFKSFMQHFECPLSTTTSKNVAEQFSEDLTGLVLVLQRANPKTRYLNVAPFSCFNEKELLFMGSTLKIMDILVQNKPLKKWVSALRMFEQIINGHFIDDDEESRKTLLLFLQRVTGLSVMDTLMEQRDLPQFTGYLDENAYDTDALIDDVGDDPTFGGSNIIQILGRTMNKLEDIRNVINLINDTYENLLDVDSNSVAKYVWSLFLSIMGELSRKGRSGTLWINHHDINMTECSEIKEALFGDGQLFDIMGIDTESICSVQQYHWNIDKTLYQMLRAVVISDYITSPHFEYVINRDVVISFHFRFYGRYSVEDPNCAIFLEINQMPDGVERVRIEVDMKCIGNHEFRQLLPTHILTEKRNVYGFKVFDREELMGNKAMEWVFAVKMFEIEEEESDDEDVEYLRDLYEQFAF